MTLSLRELGEASGAVKARMLLQLFDRLGVGRKDITAAHLEAILALTRQTAKGKEGRLDLPHGVTARCNRGWLVLGTRPQSLTGVQLLPDCPVAWGIGALPSWTAGRGRAWPCGSAVRARARSSRWRRLYRGSV